MTVVNCIAILKGVVVYVCNDYAYNSTSKSFNNYAKLNTLKVFPTFALRDHYFL